MSQEFVEAFAEAMRAAQRAFNEGDFETAFAGLSPDIEWHSGPWVLDGGLLRGREAVVRLFVSVQDAGDWEVDALEFIDGGEGRVVVHQRGRSQLSRNPDVESLPPPDVEFHICCAARGSPSARRRGDATRGAFNRRVVSGSRTTTKRPGQQRAASSQIPRSSQRGGKSSKGPSPVQPKLNLAHTSSGHPDVSPRHTAHCGT
jgi:SnoaL-like domain